MQIFTQRLLNGLKLVLCTRTGGMCSLNLTIHNPEEFSVIWCFRGVRDLVKR